ncbi:hypothetical protein ACJZ2D_008335 [Fusarium nematophilum]
MGSSRTIAHGIFGDNARLHQGDVIHQHVDLRITDPRDDKERIERLKGGLLKDSYRWILENREFVQWRRDLSGRLLWIRGDPGKGKTMLLCGIIDELTRKSDSGPLAFFFCQETESRLNSATAVLRGLIYMLVKQREPLMKHLLQRYKDAKKHLFEDSNACVALGRILTAMLEDPSSKGTVLVIDALDECVTDLPQLLELIVELSDSAVKLVVSSRNWLEVEELEAAPQKVALRLELNARAISDAVDIFIEHRVQKLPQFSAGDDNLKDTVLRHLSANANGTFLWVAIVCKAVHDHRLSKYQVVDKVKEFPQGFMPLYQRMMEYILSSPNAQLCRQILATVAIVYRTVTLQELVYLVPELRPFEEDPDEIKRMVKECGSFLNVRQDVVYFVHQSAKDFLLSSSDFMPASSVGRHHYALFTTALDVLHETLERDIYNLGSPGFLLKDIDPPKPDPLGSIVYCYVNWVRHLQDSGLARDHAIFEEGGVIERFLRGKLLHWLEALILSYNLSEGMRAIQLLNDLVHEIGTPHIQNVVMSASRFAQYFRPSIEATPLQLYMAGLLFCPSRTQALFFGNEVAAHPWLLTCYKPDTPDEWPAYLSTLVVPRVYRVMFAPDGLRVAGESGESAVKVWDKTSTCLGRLRDKRGQPRFAAFSADGQLLASRVSGKRVRIWDVAKEKRLMTLVLEDLPDSYDNDEFMAFAENDKYLVWSSTQVVRVWDLKQRSNGARNIELGDNANARAISASGRRLALERCGHIEILDPITGETVQKLTVGPLSAKRRPCFSGDGSKLALPMPPDQWQVWDVDLGVYVWNISAETEPFPYRKKEKMPTLFEKLTTRTNYRASFLGIAFSDDGEKIVSVANDGEIRIRHARTGQVIQTLRDKSPRFPVTAVGFSKNGTEVHILRFDMVQIWDIASGERRFERANALTEMRPRVVAYSADFLALDTDAHLFPNRTNRSRISVVDRRDGSLASTMSLPASIGEVAFDSGSSDRIRTNMGVFSFDSAGVGYHLCKGRR